MSDEFNYADALVEAIKAHMKTPVARRKRQVQQIMLAAHRPLERDKDDQHSD